MSRNLSKEYQTEKQKKVYKQVKLEKELAERLETKLKEQNISFAELVRNAIKKFLEEN